MFTTTFCILLSVLVVVCSTSACNEEIKVRETGTSEGSDEIVIPATNCSGAADITAEAQYVINFDTSISGELGADWAVVKAKAIASAGVESGLTVRQTVHTPPATRANI
jgi:hypothetical protein